MRRIIGMPETTDGGGRQKLWRKKKKGSIGSNFGEGTYSGYTEGSMTSHRLCLEGWD